MSDIRTVTVTSCQPKRRGDGTIVQGESAYGTWTLHEVLCTDETGLPIQEPVACFKALPLGEQQLEFERKDSEQYGPSWTVKPLKGARLPAQPPSQADEGVEMVRESVRLLAARVSALEGAVKALGGFGTTIAQTDAPVAVGAPVPAGAADDEIPF